MHFVKMQGLGNDYIYVLSQECEHMSEEEIASLARRMSRRPFGIGADGLVLIAPGQDRLSYDHEQCRRLERKNVRHRGPLQG